MTRSSHRLALTALGDSDLRGTAVLLCNHGGADRADGIAAFLENIFTDRGIIHLPGPPLAQHWLARVIARRRAPRVAERYGYTGGASPLAAYMGAQARQLSAALDGMPVAIGLRYCPPYIPDALANLIASGIRRLVVFWQYPQYSVTTVGSCEAELRRAIDAVPGASELDYVVVPPFGAEPGYVELMAAATLCAAESLGVSGTATPTVVFAAHSIPQRFVDEGDTYPDAVEQQAALIAQQAGIDAWEVAYQSHSGPVAWLGPDLVSRVGELLDAGARQFLVVPLSFVQDHLETLYDLDVSLGALVHERGGSMVRVRPVNATEPFATLCADLVRRALVADASHLASASHER